jgi:hypothetical protein
MDGFPSFVWLQNPGWDRGEKVAEAQLFEPLPHRLWKVSHDGARRLAADL